MKTYRVAALLAAILAVHVACAATAAHAAAPGWTVSQLTTDAHDHAWPGVSGDRVVWRGSDGSYEQIFMWNAGDALPTQVTTVARNHDAPGVSGNRLVWRRDDPGYLSRVFTWQIGDSSPTTLTTDLTLMSDVPMVSGDRLAWLQERIAGSDYVILTRAAGESEATTVAPGGSPYSPRISGDRLVWFADVTGSGDYRVMTWEAGDSSPTTLTAGPHNAMYPAVSLDRVAWQAYDGTRWRIFTRKVGTDPSPVQLSTGYDHTGPQVSGERIVWLGIVPGGTTQIFTWNAGDATPTQLTTGARSQSDPQISGDRIVWEGYSDPIHEQIFTWKAGDATPTQLTFDAANHREVGVSGDRIVWRAWDGAHWQIFTAVGERSELTLSASTSALAYGSSLTLNGTLTDDQGHGLLGRPVRVEAKYNGATGWTLLGTKTTDGAGGFRLTYKPDKTATYRALFLGDVSHLTQTSSYRTASVRPWIRTPVAPKTMRTSRYYTVYGFLKPKHAKKTYPVRIYKWRKTTSGWVSYGSVKAKASDYSTYTKYASRMRLGRKGTWRLRAYAPGDGAHTAAWSSGYDYVKVR